MDFYAGIDGGGTKTKVVCVSEAGEETKLFGPFNLNSIGEKRFVQLLDEIGEYLSAKGRCRGLCIGSAGISNSTMVQLVTDAMNRHGIHPWKLVGDQEIALCGALDGAPGIALIAGTGSICFGRSAEDVTARSGGWGHLFGDEGSGYALGRDALAAVAREWDGYGEKTLLTGLLASEMHLTTQREIISYAYGGDKSRIAALSRLVERAGRQGDKVALDIIEKNALEMTALVGAVAKRLGLEDTRVAMLGGMMEHDTLLRRGFCDALARVYPRITPVSPAHDAAFGAVMLAKALG